MNKIDCAVFDLDGTLVKSADAIYYSMIHTLDKLGVEHNLPIEKFNEMIGWHFEDIFNEVGIKINDFEEFINIYKSLYFNFIDKSPLYDNVKETLEELKNNGIKIGLLTTKGQDQADKIINHFKLTPYFDIIMGRRPGVAHKPSPEPLHIICEELKVSPENTLMIGDSEMDIQCGKNAGTLTCAVTYGYRSKSKLIEEAPDFIIDSLLEIKNIFNG